MVGISTQEMVEKELHVSARPEYYSGRGATTSDLTGEMLEKLYKAVLRHHGAEAAKSFVQMVFEIDVLSMTYFLNRFAQLQGWGWKLPPAKKTERLDHTDVGDHESSRGPAFATMAQLASGSDRRRDDTLAICGSFLRRHQEEITATEDEIETKLRPQGSYGWPY